LFSISSFRCWLLFLLSGVLGWFLFQSAGVPSFVTLPWCGGLMIKIQCSVQSNHFWHQLSRVWVTVVGVWIGYWIYWPLTGRNYK
jgi:hypothetical protein